MYSGHVSSLRSSWHDYSGPCLRASMAHGGTARSGIPRY
jgi:hypothetical protein